MLHFFRINKIKICRLLLLVLMVGYYQNLVLATNSNVSVEPSIYDKIAQKYLPKLIDVEKDEERHKNEILGKNQIPPMALGSVESLRLVYNIFSDPVMMDLNGDTCRKQLLDDCVFTDLHIYDKIFEKLDYTKTPFGKAKLQSLFYRKFNYVDECKDSVIELQQKVKFLLEHEEMYKKIDTMLTEMNTFFGELLWLWKYADGADEVTKEFFDQVYFTTINLSLWDYKKEFDLSEYNKSSCLLSSSFAYSTWGALCLVSLYYLIRLCIDRDASMAHAECSQSFHAAALNLMLKESCGFNTNNENEKFGKSLAELEVFYSNQFGKQYEGFKNQNELAKLSKTLWHKFWYYFAKSEHCLNKLFIPTVIAALCLGLHVYTSTKSYHSSKKVFGVIHNKMLKFAKFADYTDEFKKFLGENEELNKMLESYSKYKKMFMSDREFSQLNKLIGCFLQTDKCRRPATFFGNGNVLAKFKELLRLRSGLMADFLLIGDIDMLMSITKLYKKYASHPECKFCFAEFVKADKPYINIQKFWHPSLDPYKFDVKTNSLELGTEQAGHNILLSGPNAAGKSSTIEGVAFSIIMAMTLGIAPAESIKLTPFTKIGSHLNISYDVGEKSLFQAEMERAIDFLNEAKALRHEEFEFVIMDELFSSTNPEEGMSGAFGIMKSLINYPNCMCIVTTHFKKLQELEKMTNGYFRNYKVYVELRPNGKFYRPYKMVPGISDQSMALLLMHDKGFDRQIINDAFSALAEVKEDKRSIIVPEGFTY